MTQHDEPTKFGEHTTASEVVAGVDLSGRRAIVTGASSGIGVETARALAGAGAEVVLAVRNRQAGEDAASRIRAAVASASIEVRPLELSDLGSVRAFADAWEGPLHLLVNNAGIMHTPEQRTARGYEMQFAVNHLGHFALAQGLHGALAAAGGARIVSLSSSGHAASGIRFDDLHFRRDPYDSSLAYGQSKTANVLFALEVTRRWAEDGIAAAAVMPGGIWTNLQRWWNPQVLAEMKRRYPTKTLQQGAATSVYVGTRAPLGPGAAPYWEDCHPAQTVLRMTDGVHGVLPHAVDPSDAARLWEVSLAHTA